MCAMRKGDLAFFYHSNCKVPGIVGIMEIVREASVDGMSVGFHLQFRSLSCLRLHLLMHVWKNLLSTRNTRIMTRRAYVTSPSGLLYT